jgi:hypothetical protein
MRNRLLHISLLTALIATACGQKVEEDTVTKERIGEIAENVIADSTAITFSLDSLTSYAWEEVFIITPYTQLDRVKHITKADLSQLGKTGIETDDGSNVIAFINNGQLTGFVNLARNKGDFAYLQDSVLLYPYGATEFRMEYKNGRAVVEKTKN